MALILTRTTLIAFGATFYGLVVAFTTRFACSLTRIILEVPNSAIHTLALAFMALILASETLFAFGPTFYELVTALLARFAFDLSRIILKMPDSAILAYRLASMALMLARRTLIAFGLTFYSL